MAEYIDREKLLKAMENKQQGFLSTYATGRWFFALDKEIIKEQPNADVVKVVRCKDCNLSSKPKSVSRYELYCNNYDVRFCEKEKKIVCGTHFCSYGERKDT